jgi:putative NIF3 family GTP cyclohydrolase 1 type 2
LLKSLELIREHLDRLLSTWHLRPDLEGDGLIVAGKPQVRIVGAALNTSFHAIKTAAAAQVDLLLVHHAPWSVIDLHLRDQKLQLLENLGISLYATHDTLDRAPAIGVGSVLASLLGVGIESSQGEIIVGSIRDGNLSTWLTQVSHSLHAPVRAWPNNSNFGRVAIVPGAGGNTQYLEKALRLGCDTFLTGEGSLFTEIFAREVGLTLVYATHVATEFPAICALASRVADDLGIGWVPIPEADYITGGGAAPLHFGQIAMDGPSYRSSQRPGRQPDPPGKRTP